MTTERGAHRGKDFSDMTAPDDPVGVVYPTTERESAEVARLLQTLEVGDRAVARLGWTVANTDWRADLRSLASRLSELERYRAWMGEERPFIERNAELQAANYELQTRLSELEREERQWVQVNNDLLKLEAQMQKRGDQMQRQAERLSRLEEALERIAAFENDAAGIIARAALDSETPCGARNDQLTCNLPRGHDGDHEDRMPGGPSMTWPALDSETKER